MVSWRIPGLGLLCPCLCRGGGKCLGVLSPQPPVNRLSYRIPVPRWCPQTRYRSLETEYPYSPLAPHLPPVLPRSGPSALVSALVSALAPFRFRLSLGGIFIGRGSFDVGKTDQGWWAWRLSLNWALVPAVPLPDLHDVVVRRVGVAPLQLMEPSPVVQLEPRGLLGVQERVTVLEAGGVRLREMLAPVQEGIISSDLAGQAVWAHMGPAPSPHMHVLVVLPHVLSLY